MFDPDRAIKSCDEDELRRCKYAKSLGKAILNYKDDNSLVISLQGKWGYGKTSIINMAIEHIDNLDQDENEAIVIQFNPWLFSNQNQLVKKFFDEFMVAIKDETITNKLKSYVNKLIPPIMGLAAIVDPSRAQALISVSEQVDTQTEEESLESIRDEINKLILEKNCKIIVVIDDIDRLSDFEIRQIFQLVKLLADFPKTIYLLSFDKEIVVKALDEIQESSGEKFLEKVIQIPFEVPKINNADIERLLFNHLNELIEELKDEFDLTYWGNIYHSGFKYFFKNIRDVKRYINALKFNLEIIKDEINPVDFITIIAIQIFVNKLYQDIRNNKDLFAGVIDYVDSRSFQSRKEQDLTIYNGIIENSESPINDKQLKELLMYMFPKLNTIYGRTTYPNEYLPIWRKEARICSPDHFYTYFELSIPKDEISPSEIKALISLSNDFEQFSDELLKLNEEKRINRFLERFEDYTQEVPEENIGNIINVLMDVGDKFINIPTSLMALDTPMKVGRIIYQLIWRIDNRDKRFEILKNAIEQSKNSIYTSVQEVAIEDQVHGKYGLAELPEPEEKWKVGSDQLVELEKIVCEKINEWVNNGKLIEHEHFDRIMYDWIRWEPEKTIKFTNKMIITDQGLITFITHFLHKSRSVTITNKVSESFWTMNLEGIELLVKFDEIKIFRIHKIISSSSFDDLEEDKQYAIKLLLKKLKRNQNHQN
jgi:predicted KAP-like P-loop ATPase